MCRFCIMTCFHIFVYSETYNQRRDVHKKSVYGFYGKLSRWHHKEFLGNAHIYVRSTLFPAFFVCMKIMIFDTVRNHWSFWIGKEKNNLIFLNKLWEGKPASASRLLHPSVIIVTSDGVIDIELNFSLCLKWNLKVSGPLGFIHYSKPNQDNSRWIFKWSFSEYGT